MNKISTTIVCPTLNLKAAAEVCHQAQSLAGVPTALILVVDLERRGGVIPANAGFVGALDLNTPYICYINDDITIKQKGWCKRLIEALNEDPSYGIAGPSGPCRTPPQNRGRPGMKPNIVVLKKPLVWFCAVVRRELFATLGVFDTRFIHYADESDFTLRAFEAGWKNIWVQDVWVDHEKDSGWIAEYRKHDLDAYRKKWRHEKGKERQ